MKSEGFIRSPFQRKNVQQFLIVSGRHLKSTGMISQFIFCSLKASIILKLPRRNVKPFWKLRLQKTQKNTHEYQLTQQLSPLCDVFVAKVDHEHTKVCHPQNYYHLIMKTQNC